MLRARVGAGWNVVLLVACRYPTGQLSESSSTNEVCRQAHVYISYGSIDQYLMLREQGSQGLQSLCVCLAKAGLTNLSLLLLRMLREERVGAEWRVGEEWRVSLGHPANSPGSKQESSC